jgi:hypothetical protein
MAVMEEFADALVEVFEVAEDLPPVVLRRYSRGTTPSAGKAGVVAGKMPRLPVGAPITCVGVFKPGGHGTGTAAPQVFVDASRLGDSANSLGVPENQWTVQVDTGPEIEVTGRWTALGPASKPIAYWASLEVAAQEQK